MNKLYSERNGLRKPIKKTVVVDADSYSILWDCCEIYRINLAWKYPAYCDDKPQAVSGVNEQSIEVMVNKLIPKLYFGHPSESSFEVVSGESSFDSLSILDYIEFIANGMKTKKLVEYHGFFGHYHLSFDDSDTDFQKFRKEINECFEICGLLYQLTEERIVERLVEDEIVIENSIEVIEATPEKELRKLLEESIALHKSRRMEDHHLATEKIWDAFERMRSYYMDEKTDKKASANKIISQMTDGNKTYFDLFSGEFLELGKFGNDYRIRHSEIGKIDIPNDDYYDYFFSRCFAMIVLVLRYIE